MHANRAMLCAQAPRTRAQDGISALPCSRRSPALVPSRSLARCQASREYDRTASLRQKLTQPKLLLVRPRHTLHTRPACVPKPKPKPSGRQRVADSVTKMTYATPL